MSEKSTATIENLCNKRVQKAMEPEWTVNFDFNTGCRVFCSTDEYGVINTRHVARTFPELEMFAACF